MTENVENPGYTEESLRMLETEEGQRNAVFACYGSAAQHAQMFEQGLARFLMVMNRIDGKSVSIEDLEARDEALRKRTMGQLLYQISKYVTFEEKSGPDFDTALEARNYLMHRFFLECNEGFESEEGRMGLLMALRANGRTSRTRSDHD